ncbi:MAG: altronate dehydratase family protein, partial [Clostridia bacterium]|nr:altronate dehydratase family protein [Clostridia bacterium]
MSVTESLVIHYADSVGVAIAPLRAGERHQGVMLLENIPAGHKFALRDMPAGEQVIKFRAPIGHATADIAAGAWVHTHNCKTNLSGVLEYVYRPVPAPVPPYRPVQSMFAGYPRADGRAGIRNELWILPTVGCVNGAARRLAQRAAAELGYLVPDGIHCFEHPYGCSQLGEDHRTTQRLLAALAAHPNAGGVLILGLGCENNGVAALRKAMGKVDEDRVKFLIAQDAGDEMEAGMVLLSELAVRIPAQPRVMTPIAKLAVGLKCGGSDGLSGVTANPLLGAVSDALIACGGSTVITEVPEMFGA